MNLLQTMLEIRTSYGSKAPVDTLCLAPAIVGYLLTRRHGMLAGLVVLGSAFGLWEGIGDPAYALGIYADNRLLIDIVAIHPVYSFGRGLLFSSI